MGDWAANLVSAALGGVIGAWSSSSNRKADQRELRRREDSETREVIAVLSSGISNIGAELTKIREEMKEDREESKKYRDKFFDKFSSVEQRVSALEALQRQP